MCCVCFLSGICQCSHTCTCACVDENREEVFKGCSCFCFNEISLGHNWVSALWNHRSAPLDLLRPRLQEWLNASLSCVWESACLPFSAFHSPDEAKIAEVSSWAFWFTCVLCHNLSLCQMCWMTNYHMQHHSLSVPLSTCFMSFEGVSLWRTSTILTLQW